MRYTTRDGVAIEVGRVDRRCLDAIALPEPVPPTRKVETWGGEFEDVPVFDDPAYKAALLEYQLKLCREQTTVIAGGIAIENIEEARAAVVAIQEIFGAQPDIKTAYLRYCANDYDRAFIVGLVLYQSTVTNRGIAEACTRFAYKWHEKPLEAWGVPKSYGERGKLAVEWRAANRSGLTWEQFCALSGQEQSAHVAFWMLEDKLSYLVSSQR
jgi:hypothetical protein